MRNSVERNWVPSCHPGRRAYRHLRLSGGWLFPIIQRKKTEAPPACPPERRRRRANQTGNAVSESENIVVETAEKIFGDLADAQTINHDEEGKWKAPLWKALSE